MSTKTIFTFFILILIEGLSEVKSDDSRIPPKQDSFVNFPTQQELLRQQQQHEIQILRDQSSNTIKEVRRITDYYEQKKFFFYKAEEDTLKSKIEVFKRLVNDRLLTQTPQQKLDLEKSINNVANDIHEYVKNLPQRPPQVKQQVSQTYVNQQRFAQQPSIQMQRAPPQPSYGNNFNRNGRPNQFGKK